LHFIFCTDHRDTIEKYIFAYDILAEAFNEDGKGSTDFAGKYFLL